MTGKAIISPQEENVQIIPPPDVSQGDPYAWVNPGAYGWIGSIWRGMQPEEQWKIKGTPEQTDWHLPLLQAVSVGVALFTAFTFLEFAAWAWRVDRLHISLLWAILLFSWCVILSVKQLQEERVGITILYVGIFALLFYLGDRLLAVQLKSTWNILVALFALNAALGATASAGLLTWNFGHELVNKWWNQSPQVRALEKLILALAPQPVVPAPIYEIVVQSPGKMVVHRLEGGVTPQEVVDFVEGTRVHGTARTQWTGKDKPLTRPKYTAIQRMLFKLGAATWVDDTPQHGWQLSDSVEEIIGAIRDWESRGCPLED